MSFRQSRFPLFNLINSRSDNKKRTNNQVRQRCQLEQLETRVVPAFGLTSLRLGTSTGPTDYVYTPGNTIVPVGSVDSNNYYDIALTDPNNITRVIVPRTPTGNFATTNNSYTVQSSDIVSTSTSWKFILREYTNATTTTIRKKSTKSFYLAKPVIYADANLTVLQSNFSSGATAYVTVAGLQPGKSNWTTTWYLPNGSTVAAANTAGTDRPDANSKGQLAGGTTSISAATYLQFTPRSTNSGSDQWNWQSKYETQGSPSFQPFAAANQGTWYVKLYKDSTHFVTLPVFTIDTLAPSAPTVTSPPSPVLINAAKYTIGGASEANSLVRIWVDANNNGLRDAGEALAGTQQLSGGATAYSLAVTLNANAANHFVVTATDAAGNESAAAVVPTITEDSLAPLAPTISSPAGPVSINAATYSIAGTAAAGALVRVWVDLNNNGVKDLAEPLAGSQQLLGGASTFAISASLTQNAVNHFVVTATDGANNESAAVAAPAITEDSIAPAAPVVTNPITADGTNEITYPIAGLAEADALVRIWLDANNNGLKDVGEQLAGSQQLSGGATSYAITVPLTSGSVNHFVVTAADAATNESAATAVFAITQDSTTPPAPTISDPTAPIATKSASYTISGSAAAATLVKIWRDNDLDGVVSGGDTLLGSQQLAAGATDYGISVPLNANSDNYFLVTATNTVSKNQSAATEVPVITADTIAPGTSSPPDLIAASDSGSSQSDNITLVATPTFTGTADIDSIVTIYSDGVAVGSDTADDGTWTISTSVLADGTHSITALASDAAGNLSGLSGSLQIVIDTTQPAVSAGADQIVNEGDSVSLAGNYTDSPGSNGTPTLNWHLVSSSSGQSIADGSNQSFGYSLTKSSVDVVRFTVTDAAGNAGFADVTVTALNVAPTLTLTGPAIALPGQTLHYSFTTTDPGQDSFTIVSADAGVAGVISNLVFTSSTGTGSFDVTFGSGPATSNVSVQVKDSDDALSNVSTVVVNVTVPPTVQSLQINDGSAQRSRVTSLTVTFNTVVAFSGAPESAFSLRRNSDNAAVNFTVSANTVGGVTVATLNTFNGTAAQFGSLADGRYTLTMLASQISDTFGTALDGNGDGTVGDNFVEVGTPTTGHKLFRLYGDADGNGLVDGVDFGAFRQAFNTNSSIFDFDGSGIVDGLDFGQFRTRFGMAI